MKCSILGEEKICQIYKDTEKALDKTVGHIVQLLDSIQSVGCGDGHSEESAMKAKILEKIVYPTGGYTTFEYEMNRALSVSEMTGDSTDITCGLRIKRLSQYDPSSGQEITKSYKYGSNESGYGSIIVDTSDWGYVSESDQYS